MLPLGGLVDVLRQGKTFLSCYLLDKVILSIGPLLVHSILPLLVWFSFILIYIYFMCAFFFSACMPVAYRG